MVQAVHEADETPLEEYNDLPSENDPKGTRCYYWSVSPPFRCVARFSSVWRVSRSGGSQACWE